jgi:hypothetical protein
VRTLLGSRKAFVALALVVLPPASWAFVIYLHDDLRVFWQNLPALLSVYFGAPAALVILLGRVTGRTRNEILAVVAATAAVSLVFMAAMFVWGLSHSDI